MTRRPISGEADLTAAAVGEIVVASPRAGALFEQLGIDYCCGGGDTLAHACARRGLDAGTVAVLLAALFQQDSRDLPAEDHDVRAASIAELCDHIVYAHHDRLRRELPRIAELLSVVVRVHGHDHAELHDLRRLFAGLRAELDEHLELEERHLFPACCALEAAPGSQAGDQGLIAHLEDDHRATGDALCALRELTGGYDERRALCGTHRRLLHALRALEVDLHQHVHEENNVLFSKVRVLLSPV